MMKVKFLARPLKVTNDEVFMTIDQIKANSSLMTNDPNAHLLASGKLKDGRTVWPVIDYDSELFLTTFKLQEYLWQAIREYQKLSNSGVGSGNDCEELTAKAFSLHNAVLKQNDSQSSIILSQILAKGEGLTILTKIINDEGYFQGLLDSCDKADQQTVNPVWLDVFGEKISKGFLGSLLSQGSVFMFDEIDTTTRGEGRILYLLYNAIPCSLYASKLMGKNLSDAIKHVVKTYHLSKAGVRSVAKGMKI
jgi:hypothetical protein